MSDLKTKISRSKPTPAQLQAWDDTRAALMWYAPAFTHIFYTLMNKDDKYIAVFTDDSRVPVAATDGSCMAVNTTTKGFFKYNLMERVFITAHEILHNILNHIILLHNIKRLGKVRLSSGKMLPLHEDILQMAMDYVINAILVDSKIGKLPKDGLWNLKIATAVESVLDVYAKLYAQAGGGGGGKQPGPGSGNNPPPLGGEPDDDGQPDPYPGSFDTHLEPGEVDGENPHAAAEERNEAEWETVVQAAMEMARLQGKLPATLQRMFEQVLESKVDWTDLVRSWFARKVGSGAFTWRKPDRQLIVRDIWAPGRSGHGCDLVVLANDTSGSIQQRELSLWYSCVGEVLEQLRPKRMIVIWCDAAIGRVDEVEDAGDLATIRKKGAPGGGGTDFRPVFDYMWEERLEPDALVYLTDGYGHFPDYAPSYPVIWGSIALTPDKYPFGDVVMIPPVA